MEYSVQIVQERKYQPSKKLNNLYETIGDYEYTASFLIQEYLKEIVELEQNNNEKVKFMTYHIENMHINREKFDLVIEKYIKPINPKSQLFDHSILFYILHETFLRTQITAMPSIVIVTNIKKKLCTRLPKLLIA